MWDEVKDAVPFPDPRSADEETGLVAIGGDLLPERLLSAYAHGIFPWYNEDPILWFSPDPRMLLQLDELVVNRSLRKNIRRRKFDVRLDTAFEQVIGACASSSRPDQDGTWITDDMIEAYVALHELGFAHCVEAWFEGELVGGMYGVSLGGGFFGESMFTRKSDASKVAFVHLAKQLAVWDFAFLDCQVHTDHLDRFGAREMPREAFLRKLDGALAGETRRGKWRFDEGFDVER
ncbi:MAG: leucyl/phenylalanyl-tRNA--protein transferase [Myxococcota bacterium]|jgi:leucyl/phenylalanyl-tRNA--protein transferase